MRILMSGLFRKQLALFFVCLFASTVSLLQTGVHADLAFDRTDYQICYSHMTTGDFNTDGILDLAITCRATDTVSVLLGTGGGAFSEPFVYPIEFPFDVPNQIVAGDFNGDGISDLAIATSGIFRGIRLLIGVGDGTFVIGNFIKVDLAISPEGLDAADIDADGNLDIVVTDGSFLERIWVLYGNGDESFQIDFLELTPPFNFVEPSGVSIRDYDNDGNLDLGTILASRHLEIRLGNGDRTFAEPQYFLSGFFCFPIATVDFDNDGNLDVVTTTNGAPVDNVSVLLGLGDGGFSAFRAFGVGQNPVSVATGDFNNDGRADIVSANRSSNNISVLLGNGDGSFQTSRDFATGESPDLVITGDFNDDGFSDIAMGSNSDISVLINDAGEILFGDINLDGQVNALDVEPFIELILSARFQREADINSDCAVNLLDIGEFVEILSGG